MPSKRMEVLILMARKKIKRRVLKRNLPAFMSTRAYTLPGFVRQGKVVSGYCYYDVTQRRYTAPAAFANKSTLLQKSGLFEQFLLQMEYASKSTLARNRDLLDGILTSALSIVEHKLNLDIYNDPARLNRLRVFMAAGDGCADTLLADVFRLLYSGGTLKTVPLNNASLGTVGQEFVETLIQDTNFSAWGTLCKGNVIMSLLTAKNVVYGDGDSKRDRACATSERARALGELAASSFAAEEAPTEPQEIEDEDPSEEIEAPQQDELSKDTNNVNTSEGSEQSSSAEEHESDSVPQDVPKDDDAAQGEEDCEQHESDSDITKTSEQAISEARSNLRANLSTEFQIALPHGSSSKWAEAEMLRDASNELQDLADGLSDAGGFGADSAMSDGVVSPNKARAVLDLVEVLSGDFFMIRQLKKLSSAMGRVGDIYGEALVDLTKFGDGEVMDVCSGSDIMSAIPSEWLYFTEDDLWIQLLARIGEGGIFQHQRRGVGDSGEGPVIIFVDSSGSMKANGELLCKDQVRGESHQLGAIAMAFALTTAKQVLKHNRSVGIIPFNAEALISNSVFWTPGSRTFANALRDVTQLADTEPRGGTRFGIALEDGFRFVKSKSRLSQSFEACDVIYYTDGYSVSAEEDAWILKTMRANGALPEGTRLFGFCMLPNHSRRTPAQWIEYNKYFFDVCVAHRGCDLTEGLKEMFTMIVSKSFLHVQEEEALLV